MTKQTKNIFIVYLLVLTLVSFVSGVVDSPSINSDLSNGIYSDRLNNQIVFQDGNVYSYSNTGKFIDSVEVQSMKGVNVPQYLGYIIEFEKEPIIKKKVELEKKAEDNKASVLSKIPIVKNFILTEEKVPSKVSDYKREIDQEHESLKGKILKEISSAVQLSPPEKEIILGEFKIAFNGIALNIDDKEAKEIEKISGVKSVQPNYKRELLLQDSVLLIQNGIPAGQLDSDGNNCLSSGRECLTGKDVTIAIIDTGVDYTHEDLGGCTTEQFLAKQCSKVIDGLDFSGEIRERIIPDNDPMDYMGHGTHVASTAAGNGILKGVAPDAKIYAYKVFPNSYDFIIIDAIERAVDPNQDGNFNDKVDIISMSLGGPGNPDDHVSQAVDNAVNAGVTVVIAAGNSGPSEQTIGSPGTARKAITVGASNKTDAIAGFSSRGPVVWTDSQGIIQYLIKPDVTAPGVDICAAQYDSAWNDRKCFDDSHVSISGTSMATPHVAGAVALIKQAHPDWTPDEIKADLKSTAKNLIDPFTSNSYSQKIQGAGRIDVSNAIKQITPLDNYLDFGIGYPNKYLIFNLNNKIQLKGVFPKIYDSLKVEYSSDGINWKNSGITIVGNDNTIAEFNPTGAITNTGDYIFRATIAKAGVTKEDETIVHFDKNLLNLIPYSNLATAFNQFNFYDVDDDGKKEIIMGSYDGNVLGFKEDGSQISGWPLKTNSPVEMSSAIGDLKGDGRKEIIVPNSVFSGTPKLYSFDSNGTKLWEKSFVGTSAISCVTLSDLYKNGKKEIIFFTKNVGQDNGYIRLIDYKGNEIWNFSVNGNTFKFMGQTSDCIVAANLYGDSKKEIVVPIYNYNQKTKDVIVLDSNGKQLFSQSYLTNTVFSNFIVYPNAGKASIFFALGEGYNNLGAGHDLYKISFYNSSIHIDKIALNIGIDVENLAMGDIYGNGNSEIISLGSSISSFSQSCYYGAVKVGVYDVNGNLLNYKIIDGKEQCGIMGPLVLASFDGKTQNIFFQIPKGDFSNLMYQIYSLDNSLNTLNGFPLIIRDKYPFALGITSLNNDSNLDLLIGDENGILHWKFLTSNKIFSDWPQFQHDPQHTGCYDCDKTEIPPVTSGMSVIINNDSKDVSGILELKIQKGNGSATWNDYRRVLRQNITILANNSLNLRNLFNSQNISISEAGDYRIYASFDYDSKKVEASKEFRVVI